MEDKEDEDIHTQRLRWFNRLFVIGCMISLIYFLSCLIIYIMFNLFEAILFLILLIVPSSVTVIWYMRLKEYRTWVHCLKLKFGKEFDEGLYDFGSFLKKKEEIPLGKIILWRTAYPMPPGPFIMFEKGVKGVFWFMQDGMMETKRWRDIENIRVIKPEFIFKKFEKPYLMIIETADLKASTIPVDKKDIDNLLMKFSEKTGQSWEDIPIQDEKLMGKKFSMQYINFYPLRYHYQLKKFLKMLKS